MTSIAQWFRRKHEIKIHASNAAVIFNQMRTQLGVNWDFANTGGKGGYDEIYIATSGHSPVAMVRITSTQKVPHDFINPENPAFPLRATERLNREWLAYTRLSRIDLSPRPIWRGEKAIACEYTDWPRVSAYLKKNKQNNPEVAVHLIAAIQQMHATGITHLDLNLGNILFRERECEIKFIDFEFGPANWLNFDQQKGVDYLRLINELLNDRRGGEFLKARFDEVAEALNASADRATQGADLRFAPKVFSRLPLDDNRFRQLSRIFHLV